MRRKLIIEIISSLLILLFAYTALSKSMNINPTADVLKLTGVFPNYAYEISWGIVIAEYVIAILLFFPRSRNVGLYASLWLMIVFTSYIAYMMAVKPSLPCSCGGVISKMNWTQHLIFNMLFILLASTGIWLYKRQANYKNKVETERVVFT